MGKYRQEVLQYIDLDLVDKIPGFSQVQYDLHKQLTTLLAIGNKVGLYDAVDWLRHRFPDSKGR